MVKQRSGHKFHGPGPRLSKRASAAHRPRRIDEAGDELGQKEGEAGAEGAERR